MTTREYNSMTEQQKIDSIWFDLNRDLYTGLKEGWDIDTIRELQAEIVRFGTAIGKYAA